MDPRLPFIPDFLGLDPKSSLKQYQNHSFDFHLILISISVELSIFIQDNALAAGLDSKGKIFHQC